METTVGLKFSELSDKAKDKARDWVLSTDYEFDYVVEGWIEDGKERGFEVGTTHRGQSDVSYSVSSSQGDGAVWGGLVRLIPWLKYHRKNWEADTQVLMLMALRAEMYIDGYVYVTNRGVNRDMDNGDIIGQSYVDPDFPTTLEQDGLFRGADVRNIHAALGGEDFYIDLSKEMHQSAKDWAQELYTRLRDENEHRSSDEYISETTEANGWRFDEDGNFQPEGE